MAFHYCNSDLNPQAETDRPIFLGIISSADYRILCAVLRLVIADSACQPRINITVMLRENDSALVETYFLILLRE
jgi:hypothetical protein